MGFAFRASHRRHLRNGISLSMGLFDAAGYSPSVDARLADYPSSSPSLRFSQEYFSENDSSIKLPAHYREGREETEYERAYFGAYGPSVRSIQPITFISVHPPQSWCGSSNAARCLWAEFVVDDQTTVGRLATAAPPLQNRSNVRMVRCRIFVRVSQRLSFDRGQAPPERREG